MNDTTRIACRQWTGTCPAWCEHASDDRHQGELDMQAKQSRQLDEIMLRETPGLPVWDPDENYSIEHTLTLGVGDGWRVGVAALQYFADDELIEVKPDVWVEDCAIETADHALAMAAALRQLATKLSELTSPTAPGPTVGA